MYFIYFVENQFVPLEGQEVGYLHVYHTVSSDIFIHTL